MNLTGVPRTALMTLRARVDEQKKLRPRFEDPTAKEWLKSLGWPKELNAHYTRWIQEKTAVRVAQIDDLVLDIRDALRTNRVIELGCGFSTRRQRLKGLEWVEVDLPEIIQARAALDPPNSEHTSIARSVLDLSWMDQVETKDPEKTTIVAEGLLYYLPLAEVRHLFEALRKKFPGAVMIYDVIGEVDFEKAREETEALGAPVAWANATPFEQGMVDFGVASIPGAEPEKLMEDAIRRFHMPWRFVLKRGAQMPELVRQRSGVVMGWLAPWSAPAAPAAPPPA